MKRIFLSPPDVSAKERQLLLDAFDSNWIAPLGPHVDAFEKELADEASVAHAAALASGTAGLHLALLLAGVGASDLVATSTLTFAATVNAIRYVGATPVFIDAKSDDWTMDPDCLQQAISEHGRKLKAVIPVDLYGQVCDYASIEAIASGAGMTVIEDAAEALGSTRDGRPAGSFGDGAVLSFNGNKIITTSGGGALLTDNAAWADRARFLATQARDPAPHYQHSVVGYNYRLSNLLAAVGRGQLSQLRNKVDRRRAIRSRYIAALGAGSGLSFLEDPPHTRSNAWLTTLTVDARVFGTDREAIRQHLDAQNIEARPVWKPMHQQPVFQDAPLFGGAVSDALFADGLCLPSGSSMTDADVDRVIDAVRATPR